MRVIYPNEVKVLEFSGETGEPLDADGNNSDRLHGFVGSNGREPSGSRQRSADTSDLEDGVDEDADFPIDLNLK